MNPKNFYMFQKHGHILEIPRKNWKEMMSHVSIDRRGVLQLDANFGNVKTQIKIRWLDESDIVSVEVSNSVFTQTVTYKNKPYPIHIVGDLARIGDMDFNLREETE